MAINEQLFALLNIFIASILAGLIGYEREILHKPAGFRTHMIVGGAVALLVILGTEIVDQFESSFVNEIIRADPLRLIEAVVVGVSFIGAGTVLQNKKESNIRYLTTAASILFSAGIGIAVALRQYILAFGVTMMALLINHIIRLIQPPQKK